MCYNITERSNIVKVKLLKNEVIKMNITDLIEQFIYELLQKEEAVEIKRNNLAEKFKCVPSQINYVLQTRFTPERGYIVESRRGGGGCIKIRRITVSKSSYLMHIINNIGDEIDYETIVVFTNNFLGYNIISERERNLILGATCDKSLPFKQPERDQIRARIFKNMLINIV